jgi:hypothetical protein
MRSDHEARELDNRAAIAFEIRLPCNHGAERVWRLLIANWEIYYDARCARQAMSTGRPLVARLRDASYTARRDGSARSRAIAREG